ncbi:phosphatase PAP2 family protein [Streptomyces sp. TE33382]
MYIDTAHSGIVHGGTVLGGRLPSGTALPVAAGPPEKAGPDYGVGVFREITQWAAGTPEWMQKLGELVTEGGILVFVALFVLQWWRARRGDDRTMALALLGPVAVATVYALSEIIKVRLHEERPCRDIPGVTVIAQCPEPGDWSFPSNHSVIAGRVGAGPLVLLATHRAAGAAAGGADRAVPRVRRCPLPARCGGGFPARGGARAADDGGPGEARYPGGRQVPQVPRTSWRGDDRVT